MNLKNKLMTLLFVAIISNQPMFAQNAKGTVTKENSDSVKLEKINSRLEDILAKIRKNENEEKQFIGVIRMNSDSPINVYPYKKKQQEEMVSATKVEVKKVTLQVKDGYIVDINVYTNSGSFTNTESPITISTRRFAQKDNLRGIQDNKLCIVLKDFLVFEPVNTYLPEDGLITLDTKNKSDSLFRNVGVNTVMDLRLYTDALSLFGKESNGIAQTALRITHILHRQNIKNTGGFLGHYFKLNLNAAKFDSKKGFVDSAAFSRTSFLQKSWINAEIAYNILTTWIERKSLSTFYLDIGGGINASNLALKTDTITITGQNIFAEIGVNLKSSDNIGVDLYSRLTANYSPQTSFAGGKTAEKILKFGGEAYWNPLKEKAGRIFGRINYVMSTVNSEKKNHFFQIQLGYSLLLSKAINGGK
jgi:hypothetical protein